MKLFFSVSLLAVCSLGQAQSIAVPDSAILKKQHFLRSLIVPVTLITIGAVSCNGPRIINKKEFAEERNEVLPRFNTKLDDYLQYAPIVMVYGMDALGYKGKHDAWNQTAIFIKSELLMEAIVKPLKDWTHVLRPDSSSYTSFPSGHTAQSFVAAEFLRKEYGSEHPWLAVGGYVTASAVGALRMLNNKHWLPDIFAGAGIGILSVNIVYLTHKNKWPLWKRKIQAVPTYNGYGPGIYLNYHLGK